MSLLRYDIKTGVSKAKTKLTIAIATVGLMLGGGGLSLAIFGTASAAPNVIYNNIPSPQPGNVTSEAFEAQSASEFGGQISMTGAATNPTVTVLMSSWGCESGHWTGDPSPCSTTPGATFQVPITLNAYNVGSGNSVGSSITSVTQTFNIPYRPSADPGNCPSTPTKWFSASDNTCYNGFATPISFNLSGALPSNVILSVAFNTTHYGYTPLGPSICSVTPQGCGYDSLNVGLNDVDSAPSVGTDPAPSDAYLNSTWGGAYCAFDQTTTGTFRLDPGCWGGLQPAFQVTVPAPQVLGFATGGLTLSGPRQQISFNAFDTGANSSSDYGTVEYQNFEFVGGLHYTANILCVTVSGNKVTFLFQIPAGSPLAGTYVVSSVTDNGSPGTKDKYGHTTATNLADGMSKCELGTSVTNYTTTGGNAVVHKN